MAFCGGHGTNSSRARKRFQERDWHRQHTLPDRGAKAESGAHGEFGDREFQGDPDWDCELDGRAGSDGDARFYFSGCDVRGLVRGESAAGFAGAVVRLHECFYADWKRHGRGCEQRYRGYAGWRDYHCGGWTAAAYT